jgi:hypothetical protein
MVLRPTRTPQEATVLVYATSADLADWMTPTALPANAAQLLRTASMTVHEATMTSYYDVDGTGLPTDATTLQAFKDATCAQAAALSLAGIDPLSGGVLKSGVASQKAVGSARIDYADATAAAASRQALTTDLCTEAHRILQQAGIMLEAVWTIG